MALGQRISKSVACQKLSVAYIYLARLMRLVGMYYRTACEDFFPAVGAMHFPMLGWQQAEMEIFFAECRLSMRDPKVHAYAKMHFWSGQKP